MITGDKIFLREVKKDDIIMFMNIHNNLVIKNYAMIHPFPISLEQDEKWLEKILLNSYNNNNVYFTIVDKITKNPAGFVTLKNINWVNRNCYFGIVILPEFQGKGFGKEATKLCLNYAFNFLNLRKITLEVTIINERAIKLYEQIGFVEEGKLREHFYFNGSYFDVKIMSLFK